MVDKGPDPEIIQNLDLSLKPKFNEVSFFMNDFLPFVSDETNKKLKEIWGKDIKVTFTNYPYNASALFLFYVIWQSSPYQKLLYDMFRVCELSKKRPVVERLINLCELLVDSVMYQSINFMYEYMAKTDASVVRAWNNTKPVTRAIFAGVLQILEGDGKTNSIIQKYIEENKKQIVTANEIK